METPIGRHSHLQQPTGEKMSEIECSKYTPIEKGALKAAVNIYVPKWGVEIFGIKLFEKNGNKWINLPSREYEDNGEKKYFSYIRFKDKAHFEAFSSKVKEAIDKAEATAQYSTLNTLEETPF